jgi:hypothetical protein
VIRLVARAIIVGGLACMVVVAWKHVDARRADGTDRWNEVHLGGHPEPHAYPPLVMTAPPTDTQSRPFDRGEAADALASVGLETCKERGPTRGPGHIKVTFGSDGHVVGALVDRPPFQDSAVGACVEEKFGNVRISAFTGADVTVGKNFGVE